MSDIVKWLRIAPPDESRHVLFREARGALWIKLKEAADEIEKLQAALQTARRDALEEAAQFVETHIYVTTNSALKHKLVPYARAKRGLHHATIAAAIRALKGESDD